MYPELIINVCKRRRRLLPLKDIQANTNYMLIKLTCGCVPPCRIGRAGAQHLYVKNIIRTTFIFSKNRAPDTYNCALNFSMAPCVCICVFVLTRIRARIKGGIYVCVCAMFVCVGSLEWDEEKKKVNQSHQHHIYRCVCMLGAYVPHVIKLNFLRRTFFLYLSNNM